MSIDYGLRSLKASYDKEFGVPTDDESAISTVVALYKREMPDFVSDTRERIAENYREMLGKGLPAYYWFIEAIRRTSKKQQVEKKHLGYVIGALRRWSIYGFGATKNSEEEEIFEYFAELTNLSMSHEARKSLAALLGRYGAIKVLRNMATLDVDLSLLFMEHLGRKMFGRYEEDDIFLETAATSPPVIEVEAGASTTVPAERIKRKYTRKTPETPKILDSPKRKTTREPTERLALMIMYAEEVLKEAKKPLRPTDMANELTKKGIENITPKSASQAMKSVMRYSNHVKKTDVGHYIYLEETP